MNRDNELPLMMPVRDGRLQWSHEQKQMLSAFLARQEGRQVMVRISKPRKIRSLKQNSYYWSVVVSMIAAETGHTPEDVHEILKEKFLPKKFIRLLGVEKEIKKTTTDLTANEFTLYLDQIYAFAGAELGLRIPLPQEC